MRFDCRVDDEYVVAVRDGDNGSETHASWRFFLHKTRDRPGADEEVVAYTEATLPLGLADDQLLEAYARALFRRFRCGDPF